jgi:hypothetical protein
MPNRSTDRFWAHGLASVLAGACVLALASCAPTLPPAPPDGERVSGRVLSVRDDFPLSLLPADPIGGGAVLAVPSERSAALWEALDRAPPADIRDAIFSVDAWTIDAVGGDLAPVADDSTFVLEVRTGRHLLCHSPTEGPTYTVTDCVETQLTSPGRITVHLGMDLAVQAP